MKTAAPQSPRVPRPVWVLPIALVWTLLIAGFLTGELLHERATTRRIAEMEARANFNKDQAIRLWATTHGGVYVPVDTNTPPSPYLTHVPERDLETPSGRKLTLMNPAYMLRQMMGDYSALYGVSGHLTSLKPLRPENAPDAWETNALKAFETGVKEVSEFTEIKGEPYLRLMRPMITQEGCLKCHAGQGYQVGDVRGGVGISLPLEPLLAAQRAQSVLLAVVHGVIWGLGLAGLSVASGMVRRRTAERLSAEATLRESEARYRRLVEGAPDVAYTFSNQRGGVYYSPRVQEILGYKPDQLLAHPFLWQESIHPEDRKRIVEVIRGFESGKPFDLEYRIRDAQGNWRWLRDRSIGGQMRDGEMLLEGLATDITGRKRQQAILEARIRLGEYALGHSLEELLTRTLDECELLTGSTIGFFHFVEADQINLALQTWSTNTLQNMCTAAGKGRHYPVNQAGVWVDALRERRPVIHNDYASLPQRKGLPPGHAAVVRELVVPVLRQEQVVAILGVGNKPGDYGPPDVESVAQLASLAWDIVGTKRAEEALFRSRQLLAETERVGKVGGWEFNVETLQQTWTEEIYRIHEVEFTGQPTVEQGINFYTPVSRPIIEGAVRRAVEHGEPFDLDLEIITAKGNVRSVHVIGKADLARRRVFGFFQDITERKRAGAELTAESQRRRALFDQSPVGIVVVDPQTGKFLDFNAMAHEQLGYSRAEFSRLTLADVEAMQTPADMQRVIAEALRREAADFETQHRTRQGELRDIHVRASVVEVQGQRLFQSVWRDITERKRWEAELRRHTEELKASNEQLTRFNRVAVGRELQMIQLKREINELRRAAGLPDRYAARTPEEISGSAAAPKGVNE